MTAAHWFMLSGALAFLFGVTLLVTVLRSLRQPEPPPRTLRLVRYEPARVAPRRRQQDSISPGPRPPDRTRVMPRHPHGRNPR